jgi:hypothetical protein
MLSPEGHVRIPIRKALSNVEARAAETAHGNGEHLPIERSEFD